MNEGEKDMVEQKSGDFVSQSDFEACRNELCLRCGQYKNRHLGACSDCRWRPEKWRKEDG